MVILASGSPRRSELLKKNGIDFRVIVTEVDEGMRGETAPDAYVMDVARRKAEAAVEICAEKGINDAVIIAADTVVYIDGRILGKPGGRAEAFSMLRLLAERRHSVFTGICVAFAGVGDALYIQDCRESQVTFKPLTDAQIEEYINTKEPFDKAGSYAAQGEGAALIEKIDGDLDNVIGLPVKRVLEIMKSDPVKEPR